MEQPEQRKEQEAEIKTVKDAVEWLLLAYSLGHLDDCTCEYCLEARRLAFASGDKTVAA